jgi:PAS domain S-box-containing protein
MPRRTKTADVQKSGRKQVKTYPRATREFFRSVLENSLSAVAVIDKKGTVLYESPAMGNVLGCMKRTRIGASGFELVHPDDLAVASNTLSELVHHTGKQILKEIRVKHGDGSWRTFQVYGRNLMNNPAVGGIVAGFVDITELRQRKDAQREMEVWCGTLIENTKDGIIIVQDGICSFVNKA